MIGVIALKRVVISFEVNFLIVSFIIAGNCFEKKKIEPLERWKENELKMKLFDEQINEMSQVNEQMNQVDEQMNQIHQKWTKFIKNELNQFKVILLYCLVEKQTKTINNILGISMKNV